MKKPRDEKYSLNIVPNEVAEILGYTFSGSLKSNSRNPLKLTVYNYNSQRRLKARWQTQLAKDYSWFGWKLASISYVTLGLLENDIWQERVANLSRNFCYQFKKSRQVRDFYSRELGNLSLSQANGESVIEQAVLPEVVNTVFGMAFFDGGLDSHCLLLRRAYGIPEDIGSKWQSDFFRKEDLNEFSSKLAYSFSNLLWLDKCRMLSKVAGEQFSPLMGFALVGDSVLEFFVRKFLWEKYPRLQRDEITNAVNVICANKTLAEIAEKIELEKHLFCERQKSKKQNNPNSNISEKKKKIREDRKRRHARKGITKSKAKSNIIVLATGSKRYADLLEASIGAVFIDGGLTAAEDLVRRLIGDKIEKRFWKLS